MLLKVPNGILFQVEFFILLRLLLLAIIGLLNSQTLSPLVLEPSWQLPNHIPLVDRHCSVLRMVANPKRPVFPGTSVNDMGIEKN